MNSYSIFLSGLLAIHCLAAAEDTSKHGRYYAELQALKESKDTKIMFDEDAHQVLAAIERDLIICKNLTWVQRFVRVSFLACDVVLVTPETMPLLYECVDSICKRAQIKTPTVFITRQDGFFNAAAQKLLMSTGGILIGQKLMKEVSDDALEAVVAHEIGHIKYNHVNKMLVSWVLTTMIQMALLYKITQHISLTSPQRMIVRENGEDVAKIVESADFTKWGFMWKITRAISSLVPAWIINKRFEKEADTFAYEANGKAKGLIEYCELLLKKGEIREEEFTFIYELLQKNKASLSFLTYYGLTLSYYLTKFDHQLDKIIDKLYHETFIGAHPSPQARIKAAQDYLAQQNA